MSDFKIVSLLNPSVVVLSGVTGPAIAAGGSTQTSGTITFGSSAGNVTFGMSNGYVTASAPFGGGGGGGIALGAGSQTATTGTVAFANSNGISFGMSGSNQITASYTVPTQSTQTQPAGNIAGVGTTFAGTNVSGSMTVDTAGVNLALSVAAGGGAGDGYNSAQFTNSTANSTMPLVWAGNSNGSGNVTIGLTGSTITMSAPSGGGAADGGNVIAAGGSTAASTGTVVFSNSNNVSFGLNGATVTATATFAQTVDTNKAGTGYTSTTQAGSTVGVTNNTSGLSMAWPPYITTYVAQTNQTQASGNIAGVGTTFAGTNVSGSMTLNSAGLNLALSAGAGGGGADGVNIVQIGTTGTSGTSYSASTGTVFFNGSNNITVSQNNSNQIVISGPTLTQYLTTAALSNHSHNFATTTTGGSNIVVGTTNSAGATIGVPSFLTTAALSQDSSKYAGTGTTLGFTGGVTGSMTLNTNGLNLQLSELAGTDVWNAVGNTIAGQSTSGSWTHDTYGVSGAGGISVGVSNGTVIISGPTGGGGTTNQTGPNIAVAGSTITSGTVVFANSNGVTFGLNGQTMTASAAGGGGGAATQSRWIGPANVFTTITSATASAMNGSLVFGDEYLPVPVSGTAIGLVHAHSVQTSYNVAQTISMSVSVGIYTKVNDTQISLYTSNSTSYQITWSSSTTSGIMGGNREIYVPMNFTLPAGEFVVARWMSFATNTSNANSHTISFLGAPHMTGAGVDGYGVASNASGAPFLPWNGVYTSTTNAMPATVSRASIIGASGAHGNFYREYRGT